MERLAAKKQTFPAGVGGDQNRAKRRVGSGLPFSVAGNGTPNEYLCVVLT